MEVVKIIAEGLTTSFRYPHFIQGVHLSFEMPPPATIYGHVCSAVGADIERKSTRFAYHFEYETRFEDYEHLHFFAKGDGKMNPFRREILFRPKLTLYLDNTAFLGAFRSPRYPVVLGRSQDLMTYHSVRLVTLKRAEQAFYDGTLLSMGQSVHLDGESYAITMPRFIDSSNRHSNWDQYVVLKSSQNPAIYPSEDDLQFETAMPWEIWVDPEEDAAHPYRDELQRGIVWHEW